MKVPYPGMTDFLLYGTCFNRRKNEEQTAARVKWRIRREDHIIEKQVQTQAKGKGNPMGKPMKLEVFSDYI
jgi:hypothetical protein